MIARPLVLAAALVLAACTSPDTKVPPPKPFAGTRWQFVAAIPVSGETPYVRFGDGRLEGFGGCNHFVAGYVEDTVGAGAIAVRRIEVPNRHACEASTQAAETFLLDALGAVSSFSITADTMVMTGSGGSLHLRAEGMPGEGKPGEAKPGEGKPPEGKP